MMNKGFAYVLWVLGICSFLVSSARGEEIVVQTSLPFRPNVVGIDTALNRVYLPGISFETGERLMGVYNVHNDSLTTISLAEPDLSATGVAVNSNNGRVYLRGDTRLVVLDGYAQAIVKTVPIDLSFDLGGESVPDNIAVNEQTNRIFLIGYNGSGERQLVEYDEETDAITRTQLGEFDPQTMVLNSTTGRVYVAGYAFTGDRLLFVFDGDGTLLDTITLTTDPVYMAVNRALNKIYLVGFQAPTNERNLVVVDGESNVFTTLPFGEFDPFDLVASDSSGRVFVPSSDFFGESSVQIFDSEGASLPELPLERFFTIGVVANPDTHRVFLAGSDDFGETLLTIATPVCSSSITTINDLKNEVAGLTTSSGTINVLSSNLDNVQTALNNGNNKTARNRMSNFIDRVVNRSNYADTNPDRILLPEANPLLCGASNVLIAIPL